MVVAGVKIVPLGTGSPHVSEFVARCLDVLDRYPDLSYQLTPNETVIQGQLDRILEAVKEMHAEPFKMGVQRVVTTLVIDDRRDEEMTMDGKIRAVEEKRK